MARQYIYMKTQNHIWQSFSHLSAKASVLYRGKFCNGQDNRIFSPNERKEHGTNAPGMKTEVFCDVTLCRLVRSSLCFE